VRKLRLRRPTLDDVDKLTRIMVQIAAITVAIRGR
jgi:hypothetical protein